MDVGGNLLRQKQVCTQDALDQKVHTYERQGGSFVPEPAWWFEELTGAAQLVRWAGMVSGSVSVAGAALVACAGISHSILAYNLAHNVPVSGSENPMQDEIGGWKLFSWGFLLMAGDELVSFVFGALAWWDNPAVVCGWADRHPVHLSRAALFFATSAVLAMSASQIVSNLQDFSDTRVDAPFRGYTKWLVHDMAGSYLHHIDNALGQMFWASVIRVFTIGVQLVAGEGFNVFYLLPFPRTCGPSRELPPEGLLLNKCDTDDKMDRECVINNGREYVENLYSRVPVVGGVCTAHLVHNWLGALRMHVYASSVFLLFAIWTRRHWFADTDPSYSPIEVSASMHSHSYTQADSLFSSDHSKVKVDLLEDDSVQLLRTTAALLAVAGGLQVIGTVAKTWGIARRESSLPSNHYHANSKCALYVCP